MKVQAIKKEQGFDGIFEWDVLAEVKVTVAITKSNVGIAVDSASYNSTGGELLDLKGQEFVIPVKVRGIVQSKFDNEAKAKKEIMSELEDFTNWDELVVWTKKKKIKSPADYDVFSGAPPFFTIMKKIKAKILKMGIM